MYINIYTYQTRPSRWSFCERPLPKNSLQEVNDLFSNILRLSGRFAKFCVTSLVCLGRKTRKLREPSSPFIRRLVFACSFRYEIVPRNPAPPFIDFSSWSYGCRKAGAAKKNVFEVGISFRFSRAVSSCKKWKNKLKGWQGPATQGVRLFEIRSDGCSVWMLSKFWSEPLKIDALLERKLQPDHTG